MKQKRSFVQLVYIQFSFVLRFTIFFNVVKVEKLLVYSTEHSITQLLVIFTNTSSTF